MSQLLSLITYLPSGRVMVSVYASGSNDATPHLLTLLQGLLDLLNIPNVVVPQVRGALLDLCDCTDEEGGWFWQDGAGA